MLKDPCDSEDEFRERRRHGWSSSHVRRARATMDVQLRPTHRPLRHTHRSWSYDLPSRQHCSRLLISLAGVDLARDTVARAACTDRPASCILSGCGCLNRTHAVKKEPASRPSIRPITFTFNGPIRRQWIFICVQARSMSDLVPLLLTCVSTNPVKSNIITHAHGKGRHAALYALCIGRIQCRNVDH